MGHSDSPKVACILRILHDTGILNKTVFKKLFPSYKKTWKNLAGVEAAQGRTGEVRTREGVQRCLGDGLNRT